MKATVHRNASGDRFWSVCVIVALELHPVI